MASGLQLKVLNGKSWIQNFHLNAWKVRDEGNDYWISMFPQNTQVRNPDYDETQPTTDENPVWIKVGGPDAD